MSNTRHDVQHDARGSLGQRTGDGAELGVHLSDEQAHTKRSDAQDATIIGHLPETEYAQRTLEPRRRVRAAHPPLLGKRRWRESSLRGEQRLRLPGVEERGEPVI